MMFELGRETRNYYAEKKNSLTWQNQRIVTPCGIVERRGLTYKL